MKREEALPDEARVGHGGKMLSGGGLVIDRRPGENTIRHPSFSSPLPKDDDGIEDSTAAGDDSHGLRDDRFQPEPFLETPVSPIGQRLGQLPQSKVQLARARGSSWDFKREEKSAWPNLVGIVAVATKFSNPPAIKSVVHKDKEGHD